MPYCSFLTMLRWPFDTSTKSVRADSSAYHHQTGQVWTREEETQNMMTSSNGGICALLVTSSNENIFRIIDWLYVRGIHRSPVNSPHKRLVVRTFDISFGTGLDKLSHALKFSLICAWINDWGNNRMAGDLRRHRAQRHCNDSRHRHRIEIK